MTEDEQRGLILACASGVACVIGACIINVDIVLHVVPRWRQFKIQQSTTFLAASLSLSFGVMFFSALFGLLPEAKNYFLRAGYNARTAEYSAIGFFLLGVLGLQVISEALHRCLPSSIVNCGDHPSLGLLSQTNHSQGSNGHAHNYGTLERVSEDERTPLLKRRPSVKHALTGVLTGQSRPCDGQGKCYGYSDHLCHQTCGLGGHDLPTRTGQPDSEPNAYVQRSNIHNTMSTSCCHLSGSRNSITDHRNALGEREVHEGHHHVAKNEFLSVGVQTSIAVALHKFPEGFIAYTTNQANPKLGLTVFVALFVHNIAEGFVMALPLYLALHSRRKAVLWASALGGLAQPAGAGIAWISIRDKEFTLNARLYAVFFCITAGIMCSVGLQLFSQAIRTYHGSRLPFIFAFIGMGVLGFSSALTAE